MRFVEDERGIEGLPIRLVIALVVGVASLGVMMNMISGIQGLAVEELDARPTPEVITPGGQTVELTVVDTSGDPVANATVVVRGGTASLPEVATARTGPDGTAELSLDPGLGPNQEQGTLVVEIKPPAGSQYADERRNTEILVIEATG